MRKPRMNFSVDADTFQEVQRLIKKFPHINWSQSVNLHLKACANYLLAAEEDYENGKFKNLADIDLPEYIEIADQPTLLPEEYQELLKDPKYDPKSNDGREFRKAYYKSTLRKCIQAFNHIYFQKVYANRFPSNVQHYEPESE